MKQNQALRLLNDLTPAQFLAEYWQKKPLLIKNAIPGFQGLLTPEELAGLACEEEVESRIVQQAGEQWRLKNGPFSDKDFSKLPARDWTLLVQSVNHFLPEASQLLQQFSFIPHARLDDLMVSYAPDGGGVGPHFDSYDVFLLQGQGKRLWRISEQADLGLVDGAPLRILKQFDTQQEWLLEAGDMLYLPPKIAHWGIAVSDGTEDCMTYSIGFRAPKHQELASEFLGYLQDQLHQGAMPIDGIYEDADLALQTHPAEISPEMVAKVSENLARIQWSDSQIGAFLGSYLSEPKSHVIFEPNRKISLKAFKDQLAKHTLALDLKGQMLFFADRFYLNGECAEFTTEVDAVDLDALKTLADKRTLAPGKHGKAIAQQLYDWYLAGYVEFES